MPIKLDELAAPVPVALAKLYHTALLRVNVSRSRLEITDAGRHALAHCRMRAAIRFSTTIPSQDR